MFQHHLNVVDLRPTVGIRQGRLLGREDVGVEPRPPLQVAQAHSGISAHLFQGDVKLGRPANPK